MDKDVAIDQKSSLPNFRERKPLSNVENGSSRSLKNFLFFKGNPFITPDAPAQEKNFKDVDITVENLCEALKNVETPMREYPELKIPNSNELITSVLKRTTSLMTLPTLTKSPSTLSLHTPSTTPSSTPQTSPKLSRHMFMGQSSSEDVSVYKHPKTWFFSSLPTTEKSENAQDEKKSELAKKTGVHKRFVAKHSFLREMDALSPTSS